MNYRQQEAAQGVATGAIGGGYGPYSVSTCHIWDGCSRIGCTYDWFTVIYAVRPSDYHNILLLLSDSII